MRGQDDLLRATMTDDVVPAVTRVKSHPALLHELERRATAATAKRGRNAVVELRADLLTGRPSSLIPLDCLRDWRQSPRTPLLFLQSG
jgi:hypothetical protein